VIDPSTITEDFIPQNEVELAAALASWRWRIYSGQIYKITTKGDPDPDAPFDEDEDLGIAVPFIPNDSQRDLLDNLHTRNVIPKARQLGFSTLIEILALDQALFNDDQEVVVIAHTKDAAAKLFRKKVCFAYDQLPPFVRALRPTTSRTQTQLVFDNGSSVEVTSSARGGTPHFLHISEMGKIAAKYPEKALEITTGSLQGVPKSGVVFIESTAEGMGGEFYQITARAERRAATVADHPLTPLEYRLHFYPWWRAKEYRLSKAEAARVVISPVEHQYFDTVEGIVDEPIDLDQRAWYVNKRDTDFAATPEKMWREYPSTLAECWQASTEGKYYATAIATARREGRICALPRLMHVPVNSFWDLGASDDTAIWLQQDVDGWDHWIGYHQQSGAGYLHFITWMESHGYVWGEHFLPHDAVQKRQANQEKPTDFALISPEMILRQIRPSWTWRIVPRVQNVQHGIDQTRLLLARSKFDAAATKEGVEHIESYSREWNTKLQVWHDHPRHDEHSHGADAFRQRAQIAGAARLAPVKASPRPPTESLRTARPRATGLTA
jgi:hypothetical protein